MATIPTDRVLLGTWPTPMESAPRLAAAIGLDAADLWLKRDDLTGLAGGGNKIRKLEWTVAAAVADGADTLITTGAPQSNHARLTAAAATRLGLDAVLVFPGEPPPDASGNLLLDAILGATVVWAGEAAADQAAAATAERLRGEGRRPAIIPFGGSDGVGAHGYRLAGQEIAEQAADVRHVVCAVGSGGTMAGLLVNDGTLRWDSKVTDYVPGFRLNSPEATDRLTVADVLSHRVGLPYNAYDRDIEGNAEYYALTQKLANTSLKCLPGDCYAYQNVAFSLIGDVVYAASGSFYEQSVERRIFKPLGMNDASLGLAGIQASSRWARPHVRSRNGWVSLTPKPTYYRVAPAAGVNASASDMAQWLLAHTGHRPDVLPAPLLATLHSSLINTPGEMRSGWRRERLHSAGYALGWRTFDYAGHDVVFHAGAVQGYRGLVALVPERDLGIAILWNGESGLPSGLLPTVLDQAMGLPTQRWLDVDTDFGSDNLMAEGASPAQQDKRKGKGASGNRAVASPR